MNSLAMITGASRGLGLAMAVEALKDYEYLITVSRSTSPELEALAAASRCSLISETADLSQPAEIDTLAEKLNEFLRTHDFERITLINNAGTLEPMGQFQNSAQTPSIEFSNAFTLNVIAAIKLSSALLACPTQAEIKILNISSGAGRYPVPGWGFYCASKAALDRFSEVLALEAPHIRIASLAPGIIDTDMQTAIRACNPEQFPEVQKFLNHHRTGQLSNPSDVAQAIFEFIRSHRFGSDILDDIRKHH